jgi:hypothetical protein
LNLSVLILLTATLTVSCNKKNEDAGHNYLIPAVTDPVGVVRGASVASASASLKLMDSSTFTDCQNAGNCNSTGAAMMFQSGSLFVTTAAAADIYSCFAQSLANGGDLPSDGTPVVLTDDGGFKIKMTATASGEKLASYSIRVCESGATQNAQFTSGTIADDGTTAITLKMDGRRMVQHASQDRFYIGLTGVYSGGIWSNKQVTFEAYNGSQLDKNVITQGADYLVVQGANNSNVQSFGKFKLLGSTAADYAFDEGSAILTSGGSVVSWNTLGNTGGSAYATDVQSGALIPVPSSFTNDFTASENWDCQTGSDKTMSMNAISTKAMESLMSCYSAFGP